MNAPTRPLKILVMSGSSRDGSWNGKLAMAAAHRAQADGAQITHVDLRALNLPLVDEDLKAAHGVPQAARDLRRLFVDHDALLISSPEYNTLPTPLFINTFDWLSLVPAEGALPSGSGATAGKVVGLLAASPGAFGGVRAMPIVRQFLTTNFGMLAVPEHFALTHADQAFDASGALTNPAQQQAMERVVRSVMKVAQALSVR